MTFLDELEKKVFQVIQKNQDLQSKVADLEKELHAVKDKSEQLEVSLMREVERYQVLLNEKDLMRSSVEQLLSSIKVLEEVR
jgi:cell division septum initiation protein DivIVA